MGTETFDSITTSYYRGGAVSLIVISRGGWTRHTHHVTFMHAVIVHVYRARKNAITCLTNVHRAMEEMFS